MSLNYNDEKDFGKVKFTDKGFSIRVGNWGYFVTHDKCRVRVFEDNTKFNKGEHGGIAYNIFQDGTTTERSGQCADCGATLPKEMGGLINMLIWER